MPVPFFTLAAAASAVGVAALLQYERRAQRRSFPGDDLSADPAPRWTMLKAWGLIKARRTAHAEQLYLDVLKEHPKSFLAHVSIASLSHARRDYDRALDYYGKALKLSPRSPMAHWGLAVTHARLGADAVAKTHYQQFIELAPKSELIPSAKDELDRIARASGHKPNQKPKTKNQKPRPKR